MRARRIWTGRHDREAGFVVARIDEELTDATADFLLGTTREPFTGNRQHRRVRGRRGRTQAVDLVGGLDGAQRAHGVPGGHHLGGVQCRTQAQREPGPHLILHRHSQRAAHERLHEAYRITGLVPGDDLEIVGQITQLVARQRLLEARQHQ